MYNEGRINTVLEEGLSMLYYRIKLECRADSEISYHIIQGLDMLKQILSGYLKSIDYLILDITSHYTYMEVTRIVS